VFVTKAKFTQLCERIALLLSAQDPLKVESILKKVFKREGVIIEVVDVITETITFLSFTTIGLVALK
jgi:hypothetical protein